MTFCVNDGWFMVAKRELQFFLTRACHRPSTAYTLCMSVREWSRVQITGENQEVRAVVTPRRPCEIYGVTTRHARRCLLSIAFMGLRLRRLSNFGIKDEPLHVFRI